MNGCVKLESKKIILFENSGLEFFIHKICYSKYLIRHGYSVFAVIPDDEYLERVRSEGIEVFTVSLKRNSPGIGRNIKVIFELVSIFRSVKPDILHTYRLQPNILGTLAGRLARLPLIVNSINGLGYAFSRNSVKHLIYRSIIRLLYTFNYIITDIVTLQNNEDIKTLGFDSWRKIRLVRGSGIDTDFYYPEYQPVSLRDVMQAKYNIPIHNMIVCTIGRLINTKGIIEFVEAAHDIITRHNNISFIVVGWFDKNNPDCILESFVEESKIEGKIVFLGKQEDIRGVLSITDVFVLLSYREGMPRTTLEAMAMAKPIITTDVAGCKSTVDDGTNGYLVPLNDGTKVIKCVEALITNRDLSLRMGAESRKKVLKEFSYRVIFEQLIQIYSANTGKGEACKSE